MTKRYDNEEESLKDVINSLKELPRISAPPDFEMNLRRRINNINATKEQRASFFNINLRNILLPAGALAATMVVIFLLFGRQASEFENPFMSPPSLRTQSHDNAINQGKKQDLLINPENISSTDVVLNRAGGLKNTTPKEQAPAVSPQKREPVEMANNEKLFRSFRNTNPEGNGGGDIDQSLRAKPSPYGSEQYQNGNTVGFDGFNIMQDENQNLDLLRARMDSIKKWMRDRR
ncbi:MAG: hypothetical protein ACM3S2_16645 [Ignavibacteriales bacterium]